MGPDARLGVIRQFCGGSNRMPARPPAAGLAERHSCWQDLRRQANNQQTAASNRLPLRRSHNPRAIEQEGFFDGG